MKITATGLVRQTAVWVFSAFYLPTLIVACLLVSKRKRSTVAPMMARGWGRTVTRLAGSRTRYTEAARRALEERVPRVLAFNHGSTLDVPVGAGLLPDGGVLALKAEMRRVPIWGQACAALGSIFLDRSDRDNAYAMLQAEAARIQSECLQVYIAPEGTRSKDGTLGRFKLGAFHLAFVADAPILPVVLHGASIIWPRGQVAPNKGGTVVIDVLPEVRVTNGSPEGLRLAADALRAGYLAALERGPSD